MSNPEIAAGPVDEVDLTPLKDQRPTPLADLVVEVAKIQGPIVGVVTTLVAAGVIGVSTGDLVKALLGLLPGILALIGTILGASHVATAGAALVTPLVDPRDADGNRLVIAPPPPVPPVPPVVPTVVPPVAPPVGAPVDPLTRFPRHRD